ncbi:MAG: peptidyl-prolyl cis-trans isomerase [Marinicellaceae bacterium]
MKNKILIINFLFLFTIGCNQQENQAPQGTINTNSIMATINEKSIDIATVNEYIKKLPIEKRWNEKDPKPYYKTQIKNLILRQLLLEEAQNSNVQKSSRYIQNIRAIERLGYSDQYIVKHSKNITEKELLNHYESNHEKYNQTEQRVIFHIYKKFNKNELKTNELLLSIRQRIINGENFQLVAEKESDSETRHKRGYLGIYTKTELPASINEFIFKLKKNIPSQPIKSGKGAHIFFVAEILPHKSFQYSEVRDIIFEKLSANKKLKNIKKSALSLPQSEDIVILNSTELNQVIKYDKQSSVLLQVGDFSLTYHQLLNEMLIHDHKTGKLKRDEITVEYLENLAFREVIYQAMLESNNPYAQDKKIQEIKQKLLISEYKREKIRSYLSQNLEIIDQYYKKYKKRYYSPILLELEILIISKKNKADIMPYLESSRLKLNNGVLSLIEIAEQFEGKIESLGIKSVHQIEYYDKQLLTIALDLKVGEFSSPFTTNNSYQILSLIHREEPKEQSLNKVLNQVIDDYLQDNEGYILSKISQKMLNNLKFNEKNIDLFIQNPENFL